MLSKREIEILELLSKGDSCYEIAGNLKIAETTVNTHKKRLMNKLKAKNSCHLVCQAILQGYINPAVLKNED